MKYDKERIEAAKLLFDEVIELNRSLPSENVIWFELFASYPKVTLTFWHDDENRDPDYDDIDELNISLNGQLDEFCPNTFADATAKMKEWKELFVR